MVSEAAFANPFSEQRESIDRRIVGQSATGSWKELLPDVLTRVNQKIAELDSDRPVVITEFGRDRRAVELVLLFRYYHQYMSQFDDHILAQQAATGIEPIPVSFAKHVVGDLRSRGFLETDAARVMGLFFQIRRAFHFIDRALVGQSPCMRKLRVDLWNNIFTHDIRFYQSHLCDRMEDFSTLLLGPTGSGKGAAAASIGQSGFIPFDETKGRFAANFCRSFVAVNLSQYPQALLESELFGHTKGAFTGAVSAHQGLLTQCGRHGSIFLDEIGDVGPQIQIKLLKVLEERQFNPVGGNEILRFHGRIIAATHHSLMRLRGTGRFRDDFYYRLCSDTIQVPSLKQRIAENPEELNELIAHTVRWIAGDELKGLCRHIRDVIDKRLGPEYPWPGNVRELAQCVRSVIVKHDYRPEGIDRIQPGRDLADRIAEGTLTAEDLLHEYCGMLFEKFGTYEEAARRSGLERRTVKKHVQAWVKDRFQKEQTP